MLEPVESLVYLYYKCSKCGEVGDEVRLIETKYKSPKHVCMFCGNVDKIRQVEDIKFKYLEHPIKQRHKDDPPVKLEKYDKVFKQLVKLGYDPKKCSKAISRLATYNPSTQELFKRVVLELDNEKST